MRRRLAIDTETTGLKACAGDRIVEIGCVELIDRQLTGNNLHFYLNPEREIDAGALAVHGLSIDFLRDKPKFAEIAPRLCEFIKGAEIIIHNAPFDLAFFDVELALLGLPPFCEHGCENIIDTLAQARSMFPGKRNSLDALCERFSINNAHRALHGALLDAELLARVYLAMTRGQESLVIDTVSEPSAETQHLASLALDQLALPVLNATADEIAAHTAVLNALEHNLPSSSACVWRAAPSATSAPAVSDNVPANPSTSD